MLSKTKILLDSFFHAEEMTVDALAIRGDEGRANLR